MNNDSNIKIYISPSKPYYYPGENLAATILLDVLETTECDKMQIIAKGKEIVRAYQKTYIDTFQESESEENNTDDERPYKSKSSYRNYDSSSEEIEQDDTSIARELDESHKIFKYKKIIGQVLLGSFVVQLFGLVTPLFTQVILDKVLVNRTIATLDVLAFAFVVVAIFALLTSKRAEQNKVWVGLSKETAHQLGTPISSLMAWTEILKESYPDDELIPEMDKDVKRLQLIAERFSKIGSLPEPVPTSLIEVMGHVIDYMDRRTSQKVKMEKVFPPQDIIVKINASLFEWVIENLCKNAVDAMEGSGRITLFMQDEGDKVAIEVSDTGKGIKKKDIGNVFKPGFTTKKRGWGLGLSLAKRIVEEYHKGHIYVKSSEVGKGTTFRIELKKS